MARGGGLDALRGRRGGRARRRAGRRRRARRGRGWRRPGRRARVAGPAVARARSPSAWTRLGVDEAAAAADAPLVGEEAGRDALAHGGAAEDDGLEREEAGVARPCRPRGVRSRRAPSKRIVSCGSQSSAAPAPSDEAGLDAGGAAGRAVDALGRLRRRDERGTVAGREAPVDAVAAGDAARGVDEHGLGGGAVGPRQQRLAAALLAPAGRAGCARRGCETATSARPRARCRRGRGRRRAWRPELGAPRRGTQRRRPPTGGRQPIAQETGRRWREPTARSRGFYRLIKNRRCASVAGERRRRGPWHPVRRRPESSAGRLDADDAGGELRRHRAAASPRTRPGSRRTAATSATTRPASPPARPRSTSRSSSARSPAGVPEAAARTILGQNILGGMCARVCPTETLCEEACVREAAEGKPGRDRPAAALRHRRADGARGAALRARRGRPASGSRWSAPGRRGSPARTGWRCSGTRSCCSTRAPKGGGLNEFGIAAYKAVEGFAQAEVDWLLGIGGITVEYGRAARARRDARRRCRGLRRGLPRDRARRGQRACRGGRGATRPACGRRSTSSPSCARRAISRRCRSGGGWW